MEGHTCKKLSHNDNLYYYKRSQKIWDTKTTVLHDSYTSDKHRDWVDQHNLGVSHFGMHPSEMRRDDIRFDIFHLRSSITKTLMISVRKFMMSQSCEVMKSFESLVLWKIWKPYHRLVWTLNKNFNSFTGEEVKSFIKNIGFNSGVILRICASQNVNVT